MLNRKIYKELQSWKNINKALLITGARQVGKTYIIRQFLKENFNSYVEFNLYENEVAKVVLETSTTADELILRLSALTNTPLIKNETVIFIDEIQYAKDTITKIKFLVEDGSYKYIFSGSLLGVELNNIASIPVGYMNIIEMFPLDFEEFAMANKVSKNIILYLKECFDNKKVVDDIIHEQMMKLFNLYTIIGGFPETVTKYLETNNLQEVYKILENIDKGYRLDVSKYDREHSLQIKDIYDLIPSELNNPNKRFILKNLNEKARFYQYEDSFAWLRDSNIGLFTYNVDNPIFPLLSSKERNLFKLFLCDVGLLTYKYFNNSAIKILNNDTNLNYGAIYENVVAQELKAKNIPLFYYNNKKKGEVDFLIEDGTNIVPIEVKSGKDYKRHLALDNLLSTSSYQIDTSITFYNKNLKVKEKRLYLPIYMLMFLKKEENINTLINIDINKLK